MRVGRRDAGEIVKASAVLLTVGVGFWLGVSASHAQMDYAKTLVGKWEGEVQGMKRNTERTLVIRSVTEGHGGGYTVAARFGATGKGLGQADGALETGSGEPRLSLDAENGARLRLRLADGKTLEGTVHLPRTGARQEEHPIQLKKVE